MKRIYLFLALMIGMASSAIAQNIDLELLNNIRPKDTITYRTDGSLGRILVWGFVNHGPTALLATDTVKLRTPGTGSTTGVYNVTVTGGLAVGDTVALADTIWVTAPPTTNPLRWCDSIWSKRGTTILNDTKISNNWKCGDMYFKLAPLSVNSISANEAGLSIYPNPASQVINIKYNFASEAAQVSVLDMMGRVVYKKDLGKNIYGEKTFTLDISSLTAGLYMVELNDGKNRIVSKITVE